MFPSFINNFQRYLLNRCTAYKQVLPVRVRMDLGVMAMNLYFPLSRVPEQKTYKLIQLLVMPSIKYFDGVLPF